MASVKFLQISLLNLIPHKYFRIMFCVTILISCSILTFGYPCWVQTNESFLLNCAYHFPAFDWLFSLRNLISDWLNIPGYQIKIKLIWRLTKRGVKALISISSTIQKCPALNSSFIKCKKSRENNKTIHCWMIYVNSTRQIE